MIVVTLIQAVKLPITMVTRLPFPFDENELELWNLELWRLKKNFCENLTNPIISSFFKKNVPIKHVQEREKEI